MWYTCMVYHARILKPDCLPKMWYMDPFIVSLQKDYQIHTVEYHFHESAFSLASNLHGCLLQHRVIAGQEYAV